MKKFFSLLLIFMISVLLCSCTSQSSDITSNSTGNNQATDDDHRKKETLLNIINYDKYIEGTFISKSFSHELKRCEIKIKTSDNKETTFYYYDTDTGHNPLRFPLGHIDLASSFSTSFTKDEPVKVYYDKYDINSNIFIVKAITDSTTEPILKEKINIFLDRVSRMTNPTAPTPDDALLAVASFLNLTDLKKEIINENPYNSFYYNDEFVMYISDLDYTEVVGFDKNDLHYHVFVAKYDELFDYTSRYDHESFLVSIATGDVISLNSDI